MAVQVAGRPKRDLQVIVSQQLVLGNPVINDQNLQCQLMGLVPILKFLKWFMPSNRSTLAKCQVLSAKCYPSGNPSSGNGHHEFLNAFPTLTPRNLAGAAPCPVPITCCGCPFPQFGVPHRVHSCHEQIASSEFQNSVVIPEYEGFFSIRMRLPSLISQPISHPN